MGKHGPCYHCGVTSTPLWRNGPPEKPVLCNACGSRWRTKGSLANYTPLHARDEFDDSKVKTISIKNKILKRKLDSDAFEHDLCSRKGFDEDTSNRSSSGSAISNSESCAPYGSADASDLTGPVQPSAWDSMVPSRKRTCIARAKPSPVEKLTKDLYTLWHEQQSSCFSGSSEEDLLLDSHKPMVSVEIGHGSVLMRHPSSIVREEESEASSLSVDNKQHNVKNIGNERIKKHQTAIQEQSRRDKDQPVKLPILALHNSPLCYVDLQEIVNLEIFASYLSKDEQQQLMKLIPSVDTLDAPFSLKSMFESAELNTSLLSFQKLLYEGVFSNSSCTFNKEESHILRELILCDFTKSRWVEQYDEFKDSKCKNRLKAEVTRGYNTGFETVESENFIQKIAAGSKVMMKSPKRIITKSSYDDEKQVMDKECGKRPLSMQNDNRSLVLDRCQFDEESYDQDLLLDLPPNGSFPQAELLPSSSFGGLASTSSSSVVRY